MHAFINTLEAEFIRHADKNVATGQRAYMRNQFDFYGIKSPVRKQIQKPFFAKKYLPEKENLSQIIKLLWEKPQREFQHFAQEFAFKYVKQLEERDIDLFEFMVENKSWWDTVDYVANRLMGAYFKRYPEKRVDYVDKWIGSNNIWLQRSSLLFQLKYKQDLDQSLLQSTINRLLGSKEFFVNKAIGWVLREYSRTNPSWVQVFVAQTELHSLSRREALRLMKDG